jgi:4-amino-4-deoxy-L-arabinose transferase-like glycosyltransferase
MASNASGAPGPRIPWRLIGWAIPVGLLMVPWLAQWPWTTSDFILAGAMFGIVGGTFELAVRASGNLAYRGGVAVALATAFLLVWINLAVGIIGNEDNPLNLMFFGVIAAALVGAIVARFRADGMARAMTGAAIIQGLIGAGVFTAGAGESEPPGPIGILLLIEFFAVAWLVSAWLFRRAARDERGA